MSTTRAVTDADLMALPRDGFKRELVDGEIRVSPAGARHGNVVMRLGARLCAHVEAHGLGWTFDSSTGFWMPSGNLRVPDLSFVAKQRLPEGPAQGFCRNPPDLAVEVLSPSDSQRAILDKVGEYLASGTQLVWVIDPATMRAAVHRSVSDVSAVDADGDLDGADVVPGFRVRLRDILS